MRERYKINPINWENDIPRTIDIVSGRSERNDFDGISYSNNNGNGGPNNRNKLNDVSAQPKFERTYRFTRRKSVIRESAPKVNMSDGKHTNYEINKNDNCSNCKNCNTGSKYNYIGVNNSVFKDISGNKSNELKNSLVINIPDNINNNHLMSNNYPQHQLQPQIQQIAPLDLYRTLESKGTVDRNNVESSNACVLAMGDLYNGLESLGMALCKIISLTGQSCLKACQLIEQYSSNSDDNGFKECKSKSKMGKCNRLNFKTPSIDSYYSNSDKSQPMTLDERKATREAIEKYLSGDKINLRCNFEVDLNDNMNSTNKTFMTDKTRLTSKSISNKTDNDIISRLKHYSNLSSMNMRGPSINKSIENNLPSINDRIGNLGSNFNDTNIISVKKDEFDQNIGRKILTSNEIALNVKKAALPPFKKVNRKDSSTKRLVDKVETVELAKLNGDYENIMPKYMGSEKSYNSVSVKTLEMSENHSVDRKSGENGVSEISQVDPKIGKDDTKNKGKGLSKLKNHRGHRC